MIISETKIKKNNSNLLGVLDISGVSATESLLNSNCEFSEIKYVVRGLSKGQAIVSSIGGFPVWCTPDQEFLVCSKPGDTPKYIEAKNLTKDYYLSIPVDDSSEEDLESIRNFKENPNFWSILGIYAGSKITTRCEASYIGSKDYIKIDLEKKNKQAIDLLEKSIVGLKLPYIKDEGDNGDWIVSFYIGQNNKIDNYEFMPEIVKERYDPVYECMHEFLDYMFESNLVNWNITCIGKKDLKTFYDALYTTSSVEHKDGERVFEVFHQETAIMISMIYNKLFHRDLRVSQEARGGIDYRLFVDERSNLSWYDELRKCIWTKITDVSLPNKSYGEVKSVYNVIFEDGSENYIAGNVVVKAKTKLM